MNYQKSLRYQKFLLACCYTVMRRQTCQPPRFEFLDVPRNIGTTSSAALRWYPNSNDQRPGEIIGFSSVSGRSKTADGLRNCHSDPMFSTEGLKRARQKAEIVFHPVATATTSMQVPNICLTIIHIQNASDKYMYPHPIQWFFFQEIPRQSNPTQKTMAPVAHQRKSLVAKLVVDLAHGQKSDLSSFRCRDFFQLPVGG